MEDPYFSLATQGVCCFLFGRGHQFLYIKPLYLLYSGYDKGQGLESLRLVQSGTLRNM